MKQTLLLRSFIYRSVSTACGIAFISFAAQAHIHSADTLKTGYGDRKVADITEKSIQLNQENFNKGLITTPEQLLTGNVAGLRIIQQDGAPGKGAQMMLRSGTSLLDSNNPLVVLDGVPIPEILISDHTGFLNFINPNDIATITVLKDAAAAAVYGGRAANGVLLVTTKQAAKGTGTNVEIASSAGVSVLRKKADVLTSGQFRELVLNQIPENGTLLGTHDTDWQDVIYRKTFSHDQQISLSGNLLKSIPFRVAAGHQNQNGIVKTSQSKRNSLAASLNPSMLENHLRLNLHLRHTNQQLHVADSKAINAALAFDPTQPVYAHNKYGGYFAYLDQDGNALNHPYFNPLSMLEQREDKDETSTLHGQAHLQYKFHFFPALSLNARYAFQNQENDYSSFQAADMAAVAWSKGRQYKYDRSVDWSLKESFLILEQPLQFMQSNLRLMTGISARESEIKINNYPVYDANGDVINPSYSYGRNEYKFSSLFAQITLSIKNRFTLDAAFANDKSSLLSANNRTALSGAFGATWNILNEKFIAGSDKLSDLRLFVNYNNLLNQGSYFTFSGIQRSPYVESEKISKRNIGIAFSSKEKIIAGDVNYFNTKSSNTHMFIPISSGNGSSNLLVNAGEYKTSGVEVNVRYLATNKPEFSWTIGSNVSFSHNEITSLPDGIHTYIYGKFVLKPGMPVNTFYLYDQLYNETGKPIEKGYKKNDKGFYEMQAMHSADPALLFGINSDITYKKLRVGFLLRGNAGNYVFNYADASRSALFMAYGYESLENLSGSYYESGFKMPHTQSNYFLENASFMRMEYLQIGYDFGKIWKERANVSATATVQNAFVITRYSGQDPEVSHGIDRGQYPLPRTFSVGLRLSI